MWLNHRFSYVQTRIILRQKILLNQFIVNGFAELVNYVQGRIGKLIVICYLFIDIVDFHLTFRVFCYELVVCLSVIMDYQMPEFQVKKSIFFQTICNG